eukprot:scaffold241211_cov30-Tisochrysis_lutea.AAC.2
MLRTADRRTVATIGTGKRGTSSLASFCPLVLVNSPSETPSPAMRAGVSGALGSAEATTSASCKSKKSRSTSFLR